MTSHKSNTPAACPLSASHRQVLKERAIPLRVALMAGLRSVDLAAEKAATHRYKLEKRWPGLPMHPITGIEIPYHRCLDDHRRVRVRSDVRKYEIPGPVEGSHIGEETVQVPRYLCQAALKVAPYMVGPCSTNAVMADPKIPLAVTEAPLKALAMMGCYVPAVGLGGVMAGAHDADLKKEVGDILAHKELRRIVWKERRVNLLFDAGMWASDAGPANPLVALGAAYTWRALHRLRANVRAVRIPYAHAQEWDLEADGPHLPAGPTDQGPDDFLARNGPDALRVLIETAIPIDPTTRILGVISAFNEREAGLVELETGKRAAKSKLAADRTAAVAELLNETFFRACLYVLESAEIKAVAATAKMAGIGITEVKAAVAAFKEQLAQKKSEDESGTTYTIKDGAFHLGERALCNFTAAITEDIVLDDGLVTERVFRLRGELNTGAKLEVVEVPAREFAKKLPEWVAELWGPRPSITAQVRSASDQVRAAIQEHSSPESRKVMAHTGWRQIDGQRLYLMASGAVGSDGVKDGIEVRPPGMTDYQWPEVPTAIEDQVAAVRHSLSVMDVGPDYVTIPLLCGTYLAPLSTDVGLDFMLWLLGRSGSYKSTVAALSQAHWGMTWDYHHLPGTWSATATFIEAQLHRAKDAITTVDNFVPPQSSYEAQTLKRTALRIIHAVGDRSARGRCDSSARERPQKRPRGLVVATGEILPAANESTLARLVVVPVVKGDIDLKKVIEVRRDIGRLSVAMHGYVRWLAGGEDVGKEDLGMAVGFHREHIFGGASEHARIPTSLSMLMVGWNQFCRYAQSVGAINSDEGLELTNRVARALREVGRRQPLVEAPTAVDEYLDAIRTLLVGGRKLVNPDLDLVEADGDLGWDNGLEVLLEPNMVFKAVADLRRAAGWQYSPTEVHQQLVKAQHTDGGPVLAAQGEGRHVAAKRRLGGRRPRVIVFRREVFADVLGLRKVADPIDDMSDDDVSNLLAGE